MSETSPRYLDTVEAAAWVGLSPKTLQRMRVTGEGPPYVKWRRRVIYDRADLDDWMARRKRRFTGESLDEREPVEEAPPVGEAESDEKRTGRPDEAGE